MEWLSFPVLIMLFAVVNVAVGYLLACHWWEAPVHRPATAPATTAVGPDQRDAENNPAVTKHGWEPEWHSRLQRLGLADAPPPQDALWVVYDEVYQLHEQLLCLDRDALISTKPAVADTVWQELNNHVDPLLRTLRQASRYCSQWPEASNPLFPLSATLDDYARQLEELLSHVSAELHSPVWHTGDRRHEIYGQFAEFSHRLRDELHERLAQLVFVGDRSATIPEPFRFDAGLGICNRLGLEQEVREYRRRLPADVPVSALLVDIDRFQRLHRQLGVYRAEKLLEQFCQTMVNQLRSERGFDRIGRVRGSIFLVVLGDTSVEAAGFVAERLRQTIEASSFTVANQPLEFTISCAVGQWTPDETLGKTVARLRTALGEVRRTGRNRTGIDNGLSLTVLPVEPLGVRGRIISVDAL